jgi:hypothetical protein
MEPGEMWIGLSNEACAGPLSVGAERPGSIPPGESVQFRADWSRPLMVGGRAGASRRIVDPVARNFAED